MHQNTSLLNIPFLSTHEHKLPPETWKIIITLNISSHPLSHRIVKEQSKEIKEFGTDTMTVGYKS